MSTTTPQPPERLQSEHPTAKLLRRLWERLNVRNEHFVLVVVGREGIGKSHTALKIAKEIDPSFQPDRAHFEPTPLLKTLRDRDHSPGDVHVSDEAGVQLGNRTWMEKGQVKVNQALQLVRNHNLGLIFTLPRLSELDKQAKGRLHAVYEIKTKEDGEYVGGNWFWLKPDRLDITGEIFNRRPELRHNGDRIKLTNVKFRPPSDDLVQPYEEKKEAFQREFYQDTIDELEDDEDEEVDQQSIADFASQVKEEGGVGPYLSWHGGHHKWTISKAKLREAFDLTHRQSKRLKDRLVEDPDIDVQKAGEKREQ